MTQPKNAANRRRRRAHCRAMEPEAAASAAGTSLVYRVFCQTDLLIESVLSCLRPRDLCVFVHMVLNANKCGCDVVAWQNYYWVTRKDTACHHGVCFDRWFGGHTRLCLCNGSDTPYTQLACRERLLGLKTDNSWHQEMTYRDIGPVMWAGPTHVTAGVRHTVVVYRYGMVGVLSSAVHHGWLMRPVQMPLTRLLHPTSTGSLTAARRGVTQCVSFVGDNQYIGILCGRNMVVVRRTLTPRSAARGTLRRL